MIPNVIRRRVSGVKERATGSWVIQNPMAVDVVVDIYLMGALGSLPRGGVPAGPKARRDAGVDHARERRDHGRHSHGSPRALPEHGGRHVEMPRPGWRPRVDGPLGNLSVSWRGMPPAGVRGEGIHGWNRASASATLVMVLKPPAKLATVAVMRGRSVSTPTPDGPVHREWRQPGGFDTEIKL
jgi:hypothetical protein